MSWVVQPASSTHSAGDVLKMAKEYKIKQKEYSSSEDLQAWVNSLSKADTGSQQGSKAEYLSDRLSIYSFTMVYSS